MSSISGGMPNFSGIENRIQSRITNAAASGQISQADGTAIGSALGDIASQLKTSNAPAGAASTGPAQFRKKLDNVIKGEVASGRLTDAQATELKSLLQPGKGFPDGKDKKNDGDGDDKANASSTSTRKGLATALQASDPSQTGSNASSDALAGFLKILQDAQKSLAGAPYSNAGAAPSRANASLGLVNQIA